jgi:hypothetical protein
MNDTIQALKASSQLGPSDNTVVKKSSMLTGITLTTHLRFFTQIALPGPPHRSGKFLFLVHRLLTQKSSLKYF